MRYAAPNHVSIHSIPIMSDMAGLERGFQPPGTRKGLMLR